MTDAPLYWSSISSAALAACLSGYFSYRMGRRATEDEELEDLERRLREVEKGMVELQVIIRERRDRRQRADDRRRFLEGE